MDKELQELEKWKSLRLKIKDSYDYNDDWGDAIDLFNNRLKYKFFDPIEKIINRNILKGEGFTIMTVQCALIEALASFRTGQIFNYRKNNTYPNYEYRESGKIFEDFLLSASIFENNFYTKSKAGQIFKNNPYNAESFYKEVRCGLMHEAKTKDNWIINANSSHNEQDNLFLVKRGDKISILRTVLHYRLKQYVNDYCEELRQENSHELRRFLGRKLDNLFETLTDKNNYEWWNE